MRMIDQILTQLISIHALHEESDRGRDGSHKPRAISIHALHEESDPILPFQRIGAVYFNPRSP